MQTFLPYSDFAKSAECLDYKRLGKQRIEALDIYRINSLNACGASEKQMFLLAKKYGNHPAVKMWRNYEHALLWYAIIMCREWIKRKYNDTTLPKLVEALNNHSGSKIIIPAWVGNKEFHRSHQCNLVRKNPDFYKPKFPEADPNQKYLWFDADKNSWFIKTAEMKERIYV